MTCNCDLFFRKGNQGFTSNNLTKVNIYAKCQSNGPDKIWHDIWLPTVGNLWGSILGFKVQVNIQAKYKQDYSMRFKVIGSSTSDITFDHVSVTLTFKIWTWDLHQTLRLNEVNMSAKNKQDCSMPVKNMGWTRSLTHCDLKSLRWKAGVCRKLPVSLWLTFMPNINKIAQSTSKLWSRQIQKNSCKDWCTHTLT